MQRTGIYLLSVVLALLLAVTAVNAAQPVPWQMNFQPAATKHMEFVNWFHNYVLVIITVISVFVLGLLLIIMVRFNARANPKPATFTHNTAIEIIWTIVPVFILVAIAIPSFQLLYESDITPKADMTIKATGLPSWAWTYTYPDHGGFEFTATMLSDEDAKAKGEPRLLGTDYPVVVPVGKVIRMQVTSSPNGVIHAWALPAFGVKIDAIPGRLNETWFKAEREGKFYGQCSELCGVKHAYMPIQIEVVSEQKFKEWVESAKTQFGAADAPVKLAEKN